MIYHRIELSDLTTADFGYDTSIVVRHPDFHIAAKKINSFLRSDAIHYGLRHGNNPVIDISQTILDSSGDVKCVVGISKMSVTEWLEKFGDINP